MSDNIIDFKTRDGLVGDGHTVDVDAMLENNKGQLREVVLIGFEEDGALRVASSHSYERAYLMTGMAQAYLLDLNKVT
jgi:hypothetical protein